MIRRVNFREISARFTHIDAKFVSALFSLSPLRAEVVVRFYPWWEHPLYQEARDADAPWGFRDIEEGAQCVTVVAVDPIACQLSRHVEVTDWDFCEDHPETWQYQDEAEIFCNSDPDIPKLLEAVLARELPWVSREVLNRYLGPRGWRAPFSLGHFPYSLFIVLREELERANVRLHLPRLPQKRDALVALVLDGKDFIVARDFEVDVPDFEHRREWFDPTVAGHGAR